MNWKSNKQPDIEIYLWSSGAQEGGGLMGVTLHPGPFSIHQERCMDRLKVKTRSESWERRKGHNVNICTDFSQIWWKVSCHPDMRFVFIYLFIYFLTSTKNRSQTQASNHLGSFRLDLNTATETGRDTDDGSERDAEDERLSFGFSITDDDEERKMWGDDDHPQWIFF